MKIDDGNDNSERTKRAVGKTSPQEIIVELDEKQINVKRLSDNKMQISPWINPEV